MGLLDIPSYDKKGGIIALILAVLLSGLGILIWGAIKGEKNTIIQGIIILLLTFVFGIGWILALIWGIIVLIKSL